MNYRKGFTLKEKEYWAYVYAKKASETSEPKPSVSWYAEGFVAGFDFCRRAVLSKLKVTESQTHGFENLGEDIHKELDE